MPKFTQAIQYKTRRILRRVKARQRLNATSARNRHREQFWANWDKDKLVYK